VPLPAMACIMACVPTPEKRLTIDVPDEGQVSGAYARPSGADRTIVVAHGAGAGMDHPFMVGFSRAMNDLGVATLRFNFPYMDAGRRSPDRQPVAVAAWRAAFDVAVARAPEGEPVWASGKSFGGRMASVAVAEGMHAAGLVFLGYPLHPPGKPERVRDEHLYAIDVPMLFLQGTKDPFATPAVLGPTVEGLGARATLHSIEGGGHSLERSRKDDARETGAALAPIAAGFMREVR
jgi:predicted alpha/beta-hydrolase family hydrolase